MTTEQIQTGAPPPLPKKPHRMRWIFLTIVILGLIGIGLGYGGGGNDEPVKPPTTSSQQNNPQTHERKAVDTSAADVRNDVKSMVLDNQGYGFVTADYKIVNDSSKPSDYTIDYSVTNNATGNRVEHSYIFEDDVQPGQSATGQEPLTIQHTSGYTVHVDHVDRMEHLSN